MNDRCLAHENASDFTPVATVLRSARPIVVRFGTRIGLSLIEILIALTMTLIVLGAMMTAFQFASEKMQAGRAMMELANRARTAESLLRSDLANLTLEPRPYSQTTIPPGYFEYVEGPYRDGIDPILNTSGRPKDNYLGDIDDILAMTVRSSGRAFKGRYNNGIIESPIAEVVWFTTVNDLDTGAVVEFDESLGFADSVRIHRRALLIRPDLTGSGLPTGQLLDDVNNVTAVAFMQANDISVRITPGTAVNTFDVFANGLTDLGERKNRFCHRYADSIATHQFPNILRREWLITRMTPDDILLTDVAGFNVQVYSPNSAVNNIADMIIEPGDPGFVSTGSTPALGGFVDLGFNAAASGSGWFHEFPNAKSNCQYSLPTPATATLFDCVYDTWTPVYESDGVDQDGDSLVDEGTDGIDNDNANGVDDNRERETLPPYPHPIRGLKVSIRLIEKGSKQVHQTSVIQSFVPE